MDPDSYDEVFNTGSVNESEKQNLKRRGKNRKMTKDQDRIKKIKKKEDIIKTQYVRNERLFLIKRGKTMCTFSMTFLFIRQTNIQTLHLTVDLMSKKKITFAFLWRKTAGPGMAVKRWGRTCSMSPRGG